MPVDVRGQPKGFSSFCYRCSGELKSKASCQLPFKNIFNFMCSGSCLHVCLYTVLTQCPRRQEEGVGSHGTGVTIGAGN